MLKQSQGGISGLNNQDTILSTSKTKNTKLEALSNMKSDSFETLGMKNETRDSEQLSKKSGKRPNVRDSHGDTK